jgi:protein disulfide-isomerase
MKHAQKSLLFCCCLFLGICGSIDLRAAAAPINWYTDYEQALTIGKSENKPLLLFFTGSGWCGWCKKLEQEALNTPEFAQATAGRFVFVKLDFPLSNVSGQNRALQERYAVKGFPTIVLIDGNQQEIGRTLYRGYNGKNFADLLLKMVNDYGSYRTNMKQLSSLQGEELKKLYYKAQELDLQHEVCQIIKTGMDSDQAHFFSLERYRFLAEEGQIHGKEATQLRRFLLEADPNNIQMTHYQLAIIDFETFSVEMEKENYAPELAVAPLVSYIEKFGKQDTENRWRLHLLISQVFLDRDKLDKALFYAQYSLDNAPITVQSQIATAIQGIRSQMSP